MNLPRGIRNNNPGNIKIGVKPWRGQVGVDERGFVKFDDAENGLRAMGVILGNYHKLRGLSTIRQFFGRYAPAKENDVDSYVDDVAKRCGVGADEPYDLADEGKMARLLEAIVWHENGQQPYEKGLIRAAAEEAIEKVGC